MAHFSIVRFTINLIFLSTIYFTTNKIKAQAINGILDLTQYDFEHNEQAVLSGEWHFYPNEFLVSADFKKKNNNFQFIVTNVPESWNNYTIDNKKFGGNGFGTYRLIVKLKKENTILALKLKPQYTAYKLFVNGKKIASSGTISKTRQTSVAKYENKMVFFKSDTTQLEFIIQISNYHHYLGGFQHSPLIGLQSKMLKNEHIKILINSFLLGSILIMFLYHLLLFVIHRKNYSALYFAIFCLMIFIRVFVAGNHYEVFFFELNWNIVIFLELFSFIMAVPIFLLYFNSLFKNILHYNILKIVIFLALVQLIVISVTPPRVYLQYIQLFEIFILLSIILITIMTVVAVINRTEYIGVFLIGFIILSSLAANDILTQNGLIKSVYSIHFGLFAFIFTQAFLLSKKFSKAFIKNEELTHELLNVNTNLEEIVSVRTLKVKEQKKQIEKHLNELNTSLKKLKKLENYKEGLTTMIVHDIKNPLNIILNCSKDNNKNNNELINAANKIKNMVSNILDIQKYENAEMKVNKETVSLTSIIKYTFEQVKLLLKEKNIRLNINIDNNISVYADKDILVRIFVNLLTNAIKFSPLNQSILINAFELEKNTIRIEIIDNGPGINKKNHEVIFEKFGQLKIKNSGKMSSVGLGLAFCKIAVEAHHHKISVESEEGKGAMFWFCLDKAGNDSSNNTTFQAIEQSITLNNKELIFIKSYIDKIQHIEFYKISELRNNIKQIPDISENIKQWKHIVNRALITQNKDLFNKLIMLFLKNKT